MAGSIQRLTDDWLVWAGLVIYTALRLALLPSNPAETQGFGHDSAYIAIVADNLKAGRGYVNDAHWLVFLHPQQLPMPYHNANPLYPTLVAGVSGLTSRDAAWAGFAISAFSSSALFAALFILATVWTPKMWERALLAAAGTFFPVVFEDSLNMAPDALCTALTAWFVVSLVRWHGVGALVLAGILFGLAWLTRSSTLFVLPAAFVYLWMREGPRLGALNGIVVVVAAVIVASGWLYHTAVVWGNPLRSDAGYYLMQDYHSRNLPGLAEEYWHGTAVPLGLFEVALNEPLQLGSFYIKSIPVFWRNLFGGLCASSRAVSALLIVVIVLAGWRLRDTLRATPLVTALFLYALTTILVLTLRAESLEVRYLAPLSVALAMAVIYAWLQALPGRSRDISAWLLLATGAVWWLGWTPLQDGRVLMRTRQADEARVEYYRQARTLDERFSHGQPVVVGYFPYYFTHATSAPALSIPAASDDYLRDYMRKYHVRWVFLTEEEMKFWRPQWQVAGNLPPWLRFVEKLGTAYVFELRE